MPLGNLTSQFFANLYLNELDYFIKHKLNAKHYLRYVDDFVILHHNKEVLEKYFIQINKFLIKNLNIELHPEKSKILTLNKGINLLGFRIFYHHKLLKKSNIKQMKRKLELFEKQFENKEIDYDEIYASLEGWLAYASKGNTYNLRKNFTVEFENSFPNKIADVEINRWLKVIN